MEEVDLDYLPDRCSFPNYGADRAVYWTSWEMLYRGNECDEICCIWGAPSFMAPPAHMSSVSLIKRRARTVLLYGPPRGLNCQVGQRSTVRAGSDCRGHSRHYRHSRKGVAGMGLFLLARRITRGSRSPEVCEETRCIPASRPGIPVSERMSRTPPISRW
jgi:hypothetical protein